MKWFAAMVFVIFVAQVSSGQQTQFPTDPKTGRALGAKQTSPEDLRRLIDKNTKTLIIDVRDAEEFEKETIKGAVNIPLAQLEPKLKDIPKDTTLVFT